GAHAPADQEARIVVHLARRQRTAGPAETLGAARVALTQRFRRERQAGDRVDRGVVADAEVERVDAAGEGQLVDGAFKRDRSGRLAGRAHEQRRAAIDAHRLVRGPDGGAGIERVRRVGGRLEEVLEGARYGPGAMLQRGETTGRVGAGAQALARGRAM